MRAPTTATATGPPTAPGVAGATRHLLRDDDLTAAEQAEVLDLAAAYKAAPFDHRPLAGPRTVALLFGRPTLRSQVSFAAGVAELGGFPLTVDSALAGVGSRESVEDVARVLGRQVAAVVWRTPDQEDLRRMAGTAGVPVVNALTDDFHPCQLLADLLAVRERLGRLAGLRVVFLGDAACNMGRSWLLAGALAGMHVTACAPPDLQPDEAVVARAAELAAGTGGSVAVASDPAAVVAGADVLVTDTWVSMGREEEAADRLAALAPYALTRDLLDAAGPDAIALHCLPAHRGEEIEAEVLDGPRCLAFDEAEDRRHVQKAVLAWLLHRSGVVAATTGGGGA